MKTRFIVNPRSGASARALPLVCAFAKKHGAGVVVTERPHHATELAARAIDDECELIVAVGGDGTMNEIAGVLAGTPAILGLVPCGSGDGLGRSLGLHGTTARALSILHSGRPRFIDTGIADSHPFFTVAGLGFEAEIAQKFNALEHRGFFRYLTTSARALLAYQSSDYVVTHGGRREALRAFTLAVANTDQYGNDARIAPHARVDDGLLDLCAVPPVNFLNGLPLIFRLFHGTLAGTHGAILRRGAGFVVERAAPGPIHTDGEVHLAGLTVEFSIRPASLRVMVPPPYTERFSWPANHTNLRE